MRVPWIRVHGDLIDRPVVTRLSLATGIGDHEAVGVLVTFWSGVSKHATNGYVADQSDVQLEKWAKWKRKRGAFAKWVREHHLDDDGRVREWDEYAGKLEVIRERDRQRKSSGNPKEFQRNGGGIPAENLRNSTATRANETRRDEDETKQDQDQKRTARFATPDPPWVAEAVAIWKSGVGLITPIKMRRALTPLVDDQGFDRVRAALEVYVSPDEGPPADKPKKPEWFAEGYHRWRSIAETPLDDGQGALTERGRRLMARTGS